MVTWGNLKRNKIMENKVKCKCGQSQDSNGNCDGSHAKNK